MGSGVLLSYRGEHEYGTDIGGCVSLLAYAFFLFFTFVQLYAWVYHPAYNQVSSQGYLKQDSNITYTIGTNEFLPTFYIASFPSKGSDPVFNMQQNFTAKYQQYRNNHLEKEYAAVNCKELI